LTPIPARWRRSSRARESALTADALTAPPPGTPAAGRARGRPRTRGDGLGLALGVTTLWLSVIVLLPLAALVAQATKGGWAEFWHAVSSRVAVSALVLTLVCALVVSAINAVMGTLVAWVLVRDDFPGKRVVNAMIDLPFALPTIVAGIVLLSLYGPGSPLGVDLAFTRAAIVFALAFVTLPFVVRAVQPVLLELDHEMEEAATSLGASAGMTFRRVVLPNLLPAILSGATLSFARAVGEFGSIVLISGNIPFHTQVSSVYVYGLIQSDAPTAAAAVATVLLAISLAILFAIRFAGQVQRGR
jgi:sulfate transport system permease protein